MILNSHTHTHTLSHTHTHKHTHAHRGAVAADGRIEPGDMLLEVNDICFESMSNDDAVRTLREIVQHPG